MDYKSTSAKLVQLRREIATIRKKMREVQAGVEPEEVADYQLATMQGTVRLSQLFAGKTNLILIIIWAPPAPTARCGPTD